MKYFKSKGMTLDNWIEGIVAGCKGDVMVLYGLCLLIERHAWVHLKDGKVWTSLSTPTPQNHMKKQWTSAIYILHIWAGASSPH